MDPNYKKPLKWFAVLKPGKKVATLKEGVEYDYKFSCDCFGPMFKIWNGKEWLIYENDKAVEEHFEINYKQQ